jgi:hypothetical protein
MTDRSRTPRTLLIPDHVWQAYEQMASDMGSERDGLISQALFSFARLNGYLVPSDLQRFSVGPPPAASGQGDEAPPPTAVSLTPVQSPAKVKTPPKSLPVRAPAKQDFGIGATMMEMEAPKLPPARNVERMQELAHQLQHDPAGDAPLFGQKIPTAILNTNKPGTHTPAVGMGIEVDDALLGDDANIQATSMELPSLAGGNRPPLTTPSRPVSAAEIGAVPLDDDPVSVSGVQQGGEQTGGHTLVLTADGRELDRVVKERFLIGRGKHCDLIINSGKVSREHAAITREGSDYFIEDLGSSNGTWYDKRRITKRQIQEGDEYFICAEKLACSFR